MLTIESIRENYGHSMAVIIAACRVHFGTATFQELNHLLDQPSVNYPEIALHSRLHRIRTVVFRILLQANCTESFKARLKTELHSITLSNFSIAKETERIIQALSALGITALPYKGVAYSKQFYGDISMRESSDIDLVIQAEQLEKTFSFFKQDGYKGHDIEGFKRMNRDLFFKQQKDFCFDKKTKEGVGFHVELHWKILHPNFCAPADISQFNIDYCIQVALLVSPKNLLSNKEHVRALVLHHWVHDNLEYLKTIIDITQGFFILAEENKGDYLTGKNTNNGLGIASYCTEQLFGIKSNTLISDNKTIKRIGDKIVCFNLNSSAGKLKQGVTRNLIRSYWISYNNQVQFLPSSYQKIKFSMKFWASLLLPKQGDINMVGLPKPLRFLYILVRPFRIFLRKKKTKMSL